MAAYAAATATTASLEKIRDAATHNQSTPAKTTSLAYRDALVRLFILDPVDGWMPTGSHLRRLTQRAKHHLADPALAVALPGLTEEKLLAGEGDSTPSPATAPLLAPCSSRLRLCRSGFSPRLPKRTSTTWRSRDGGREIDLIVEGSAGEVVALEVKLSTAVDDADVRHLRWLGDAIGDLLRESVVITAGPHAFRRKDGICVVPLALLGP